MRRELIDELRQKNSEYRGSSLYLPQRYNGKEKDPGDVTMGMISSYLESYGGEEPGKYPPYNSFPRPFQACHYIDWLKWRSQWCLLATERRQVMPDRDPVFFDSLERLGWRWKSWFVKEAEDCGRIVSSPHLRRRQRHYVEVQIDWYHDAGYALVMPRVYQRSEYPRTVIGRDGHMAKEFHEVDPPLYLRIGCLHDYAHSSARMFEHTYECRICGHSYNVDSSG